MCAAQLPLSLVTVRPLDKSHQPNAATHLWSWRWDSFICIVVGHWGSFVLNTRKMIGNDTMNDLEGRMEALLLQESSYTSMDYLSFSNGSISSSFDSDISPSVHVLERQNSTGSCVSSPMPKGTTSFTQQVKKRRSVEISHEISPPASPSVAVSTRRRFIDAGVTTTPPATAAPRSVAACTAHEIPPSPSQTNLVRNRPVVSVATSTVAVPVPVTASAGTVARRQQHQQQHRMGAVSPSGVDQFDMHCVVGGIVPTMQDWRAQIAEWFFKVADSLSMSREIVVVACSYLDRYMSTFDDPMSVSRRQFQLISITCLYLATKLYDHKVLPPQSLVNLSRGCFSAGDIERMEMKILAALQWRLSPPTPLTFAKHFLLLLPSSAVSRPVKRAISDVAKYLTELSVIDYTFVSRKASSVGLAAILTALDVATYEFELSAKDRLIFERAIYKLIGKDSRNCEVAECRFHLRNIYRKGGVHSSAFFRRGSAKRATSRSKRSTPSPATSHSFTSTLDVRGNKKRRFHTSELFVTPRSTYETQRVY